MKTLCSACLVGINCRYDGNNNLGKAPLKLRELYLKGELIPVCPEQLGGLPTPRVPSEIQGMSGEDVLDGLCKVLNKNGEDVTQRFINGAREVLKIAQFIGAGRYIGVQKSPSCGYGKIHDGTFSDTLVEGNGVTTALLRREGIYVVTEKDFED